MDYLSSPYSPYSPSVYADQIGTPNTHVYGPIGGPVYGGAASPVPHVSLPSEIDTNTNVLACSTMVLENAKERGDLALIDEKNLKERVSL